MKIYGLSGLGADERVYSYIDIGYEIEVIKWLNPLRSESLSSYSNRLIKEYKMEEEDSICILGVSFGGLLAVEIGKQIRVKKIILISSASKVDDLRSIYRLFGRSGIVNYIPESIIKPPIFVLKYLFGTKETDLLGSIISDSDNHFIKWALNGLLTWKNQIELSNVHKIHGNKDLLIPMKRGARTKEIDGGGHFMIVDKSEEVSQEIKNILNRKANNEG